jgi:hypothetical protein
MTTKHAFISYRREDAAGWAGRLGDDLEGRIGSEHVFRDVKIPPGVDYELHIEQVLDACDVVLVMIGPRWAELTDASGRVRLHDPEDLLFKEIERALQRPDVEVIPLLVERARMPAASALPAGLRALTRRQAFELSDHRWARDFDELCADVFGLSAEAPKVVPTSGGGAGWMVAAAAGGVLVAGLFTGSLAAQRASEAPDPQRLIVYAAERGLIWALAGAFALAAACYFVRDDRAGAIGWGFIGAASGAAAGAVGGAVFMLLTDAVDLHEPLVRHGVSTAITGAILGDAAGRVMRAELAPFRLAGVAGGLLGAALAIAIQTPHPGVPEGPLFLLIEAIAVFSAMVAVGIAFAPQGRPHARAGAHAVN